MPDLSGEPEETPSALDKIKAALGSILSPLPIGFVGIFVVLGLGFAYLAYALSGVEKLNEKVDDKGFLFLGAIIFARTVLELNFYPMQHKKKIMKGDSGNLRTNMAIYKPLNEKGQTDEDKPAIVMATGGEVGKYNRANRSLSHFTETVPSLLFMLFLVGPVFPLPTFVIVCVFCLGRILHQRGEAKGYGSHGKGFMLVMLAGFVLEGLCWICAATDFFDLDLPTF